MSKLYPHYTQRVMRFAMRRWLQARDPVAALRWFNAVDRLLRVQRLQAFERKFAPMLAAGDLFARSR